MNKKLTPSASENTKAVLVKPGSSRREVLEALRQESAARHQRIDHDFDQAFEFAKNYANCVTVFGSARLKEDHPYYQKTRDIGKMLAEEGYTVVTGGAGGLMEAANRGAFEAGGTSIGLNIELPHEQHVNPYLTRYISFRYFFSRKVFLTFNSNALIACPGGFGTLDELFECITLIQTKKMPAIPVILVGTEFWKDIDIFAETKMLESGVISRTDLDIYSITDDVEVIRALLTTKTQLTLEQAFTE